MFVNSAAFQAKEYSPCRVTLLSVQFLGLCRLRVLRGVGILERCTEEAGILSARLTLTARLQKSHRRARRALHLWSAGYARAGKEDAPSQGDLCSFALPRIQQEGGPAAASLATSKTHAFDENML